MVVGPNPPNPFSTPTLSKRNLGVQRRSHRNGDFTIAGKLPSIHLYVTIFDTVIIAPVELR
jgi:hypothetical protein